MNKIFFSLKMKSQNKLTKSETTKVEGRWRAVNENVTLTQTTCPGSCKWAVKTLLIALQVHECVPSNWRLISGRDDDSWLAVRRGGGYLLCDWPNWRRLSAWLTARPCVWEHESVHMLMCEERKKKDSRRAGLARLRMPRLLLVCRLHKSINSGICLTAAVTTTFHWTCNIHCFTC